MNSNYEECNDSTTGNERSESLITATDVHKSFGDNKVLEGFSLDIKNIIGKPQITTLLGQSGSGKTTALRIIAGLDKADKGCVTLSNGEYGDAYCMNPVEAGQVGVVFQKYPLFDHLTIWNNLVDPALKTGRELAEAENLAEAYIREFDLTSVKPMETYPVQLSGGQRQRVAILQQLMIPNRHFIVLDEPFSGLDVKNLQAVMKLLYKVASLHTLNTFLIVTHDVTNALIISDTVLVLGRESVDGKPQGGSKIVRSYDLIAEGLAYQKNIEDISRFTEIRKEIKYSVIPNV